MRDNQPEPTPEQFALHMDEAAKASGLSRAKLYELMRDGVLPSVKVGGRRLILPDDLRSMFAQARTQAAA